MADSFYPLAYGGGRIDFSPLADIGESIGSVIGGYKDKRDIASAWTQAGGDYNKAVQALLEAGNTRAAAKVATIRDKLEGSTNRFGLQPIWNDKGEAFVLNSGTGQASPLNGNFPPRMNYVQTPQGVYPSPVQGGMPQAQPSEAPATQPGELPVYGSPEAADQGLQAPQYGQPIPKDYTNPEAQKAMGDTMGKARAALPAAEAMTRRVIGALNRIETMPGLDRAVGPIQSRLPTVSNDVADVEAMIKQAVGGVFTTGYESLRGAQAITDIEGQKATAAIARLEDLRQSDPGYRTALADAKYETFELMNIVRRKAGLPPQENPYPPPSGQHQSPSSNGDGWTDLGNGIRIRQK